jgi:Pectate lyase superfamily protein
MSLTKATYSMISGATVNVFDFMTAAQIADVQARTATIDTAAAITAAIASLSTTGGVVRMPKGRYLTSSKVVLTTGVSLVGDGQIGGPSAYDEGVTTIYAVHNQPAVLSLVGAVGCTVSDICLQGGPTSGAYPQAGLLLGRSTSASAGYHHISRVAVYGNFSVAGVYSIASEDNYWEDLNVWVYGGGAKNCFYTSIGNSNVAMTEPLVTSSNLDNVFVRFWFTNSSTDANAACLYIDAAQAVGSWSFYGGYATAYAGSYVTIANGYVDGLSALGPFTFVSFNGERLSGGDPLYGFNLTASTAVTLPNLNIIGGRFDFQAGTNHYQIRQSNNLTLTQPNITLKPPEAFPYAQILLYRDLILGGTMNVGRYAAWQAATLAGSWVSAFGSPYPTPSYMIDSTGRVHLRGTVTGGTGTIMTLPVGYRPVYTWRLPSLSNGAVALVTVDSSGVVSLNSGSGTNLELGGLSFDMTASTLA